jgi:hypothetical protein
MLFKILIFSVTTAVTLSILTSDALAWGCSRSCSGSGNYGGVSRIPAPPREATATTHTLVLLPRPDATETPTLAATPAPATTITVAIRPEATAPTTMADVMVAEGSMRRRSADRMEPPTLRGFIVVEFGKNTPTTIVK